MAQQTKQDIQRQQIAGATEAFLQKGGTIKQIAYLVTTTQPERTNHCRATALAEQKQRDTVAIESAKARKDFKEIESQ